MTQSSPRTLVITQGDPNGVGPELLLRAAAQGLFAPEDRVVASATVLDENVGALDTEWARRGRAALEPVLVAGAPDSQVRALELGVDMVLEGSDRALVTAPIDKAACNAEGFSYPGHTEYLAARAGVEAFCMAMVGPTLRVALATIHVPLAQVAGLLDVDRIVVPGRLLALALRDAFGIDRPRIGILGLNPHAGERGLLGDEEARVITPAIERLREWAGDRFTFTGPLAADTAIPLHARGELDGVVAMYHDQGLGPFKLLHFSDGVNMTLGLPFVRTSPDHGTARDIVGKGIADPGSMFAAIRIARGGGS